MFLHLLFHGELGGGDALFFLFGLSVLEGGGGGDKGPWEPGEGS